MTASPKITVVTPNFNQGRFLEQTILSVLDQNYPNLEYIIIDGGSSDSSVEIIEKYKDRLTYWVSEKDQGMYYAIQKGFERSTGEVMCWINSDDLLWPGSLEYVATVFAENPKIQWLQGYPSVIDEDGKLLYQRDPVGSKEHFYFGNFKKTKEFIQQESTFWRRDLWELAGANLNLNYSLAADFELWLRFFRHEKLYCSRRQLAAFRKRVGQQSGNIEKYLYEATQALNEQISALPISEKIKLKLKKRSGTKALKSDINWIDET